MSVGGIVNRGRALALRLMVDTCTIRRQTGVVTDPNTGVVTPTYQTVYTGPCKVQTFTNRELLKTGGEHQFIEQRYEIHIPITGTGIEVNDLATVTAAEFDPDTVGRNYRVVALMNRTLSTARRLSVEEEVA